MVTPISTTEEIDRVIIPDKGLPLLVSTIASRTPSLDSTIAKVATNGTVLAITLVAITSRISNIKAMDPGGVALICEVVVAACKVVKDSVRTDQGANAAAIMMVCLAGLNYTYTIPTHETQLVLTVLRMLYNH